MDIMELQPFAGEDEVIKMNAELAEMREFTAEDIENLPEDVRAELIDGRLFFMETPRTIHQRLLGKLLFKLQQYIDENGGNCEVIPAPFAVRIQDERKNFLEPDLVVVCDPEKIKEDGCHGAPDLIIEITSESTRKRDYGTKMLKYRTAGVKEYWIVDPQKKTVLVYWYEDEEKNCLYGWQDEIEFHLFPGLKVQVDKLADM